jgi:DmsE family decaheme c-type cytochrome
MKILRQLFAAAGCAAFLFAGNVLAAEAKPAPKDIVLKGDAKCTSCHDEADAPELLRIGKTRHGTKADGRTPTCTSCHGESKAHTDYKGSDKPPKPEITFGKNTKNEASARSETCLTCHQGGKRIHWQGGVHANQDVACSSCHKIHTPHDKVRSKDAQAEVCFTCHKEQRNQISRPSHHPIPEGKMNCTSCHDVHGDNQKMMAKFSVNDTCYTCHMEKRGPFVRTHQPVQEDCSICHNPHGSTISPLLKARAPFSCQECHEPTGHRGNLGTMQTTTGSTGTNMIARGCLNCHTQIHGTNNPRNDSSERTFRK